MGPKERVKFKVGRKKKGGCGVEGARAEGEPWGFYPQAAADEEARLKKRVMEVRLEKKMARGSGAFILESGGLTDVVPRATIPSPIPQIHRSNLVQTSSVCTFLPDCIVPSVTTKGGGAGGKHMGCSWLFLARLGVIDNAYSCRRSGTCKCNRTRSSLPGLVPILAHHFVISLS